MNSIRIIADDHVACTVSLAKAFVSTGSRVQYVFVTAAPSLNGLEGVNINTKLKLGVNRVKCGIHTYIDSPDFDFVVFRYPRPLESLKKLQWLIQPLLGLFFFLNRCFWKEQYDLTNFVGRYQSNIYCHIIPFVKQSTILISLHEIKDHFRDKYIDTPFLRYIEREEPKIIFHSDSLMNQWKENHPHYKGHYRRIYFGKCDSFKTCNYKETLINTKDYILFFGFFKAYKGLNNILYLLRNFPSMKKYTFVLAGAGTLPEVEELKKNENVILYNKYINNDELASLIYRSKVVICPYNTVSQSGVVQTSFAFDKPVIAPDLSAFKEVIDDRVTGYLYPSDQVNHCAGVIDEVYTNALQYKEIVNNIRTLDSGDSKLSWGKIVKEYKQFFEDN